MSLREMLSDYWYAFQQELFPRLESELGPMGERYELFVVGSGTGAGRGSSALLPGLCRGGRVGGVVTEPRPSQTRACAFTHSVLRMSVLLTARRLIA